MSPLGLLIAVNIDRTSYATTCCSANTDTAQMKSRPLSVHKEALV